MRGVLVKKYFLSSIMIREMFKDASNFRQKINSLCLLAKVLKV